MVEAGALEPLLNLLTSNEHKNVLEAAVWALRHLASDPSVRESVVAHVTEGGSQVMPALVALCTTAQPGTILEGATYAGGWWLVVGG